MAFSVSTKIAFALAFSAFAQTALAQFTPAQSAADLPPAAVSPVAYIYVASVTGLNTYAIEAFTAGANGELTPVSGSPFPANVAGGMAAHGQYLFGTNGISIYSFAVESGGALRKVASLNAQQFNGAKCGGPSPLFIDRTGGTLYALDNYGSQCANNTYQSFGIQSSGVLKYLGMTAAASPVFSSPLSFTGNNVYGFGSSCYHYSAGIYGFSRGSNGALTLSSNTASLPAAQQGNFYCTWMAAADTANHVAISVQQLSGSTWTAVGQPQIATYTVISANNIVTNSKYSNMPHTAVNTVSDLKMSPSGQLLAVAGSGGLQVFHFNGSNPVTPYTNLLTRDEIDQMFWDRAGHLYAISRTTSNLFVFTVTPTSVKAAPGSPYTISSPRSIVVLPRT
jgi:hypothetical protein